MVMLFLNLGEVQDDQLEELKEDESGFADYIANLPIPPVWCCARKQCYKEQEVAGVTWPELERFKK